MEKLYYTNQYQTKFEAKVIEVKELNNKYHIALDKTAFFPGGGGQCCDLGKINEKDVLEVYEENEIVYHVISENIDKGSLIKGEINWNRREDGMHQHLAQHVLSGCFFKLFSANTVSIHLGKEISTVDIIGHLDEDKIKKAEKMANDIVRQNIMVEFIIPSYDELKNLNLRRDLPNTDKEIRVVKIGDLDINACCGVHPKSTLDLRLIKIKKYEKNKNNTRIEFLAGKRAIEDSLKNDKIIKDICNYLSSNEEESLNSIKNLKENLEILLDEKKKIEEELMKYEIEHLISTSYKEKEILIIKKIFQEKSINYVRRLSGKLADENNIICLFAIKNKEKANIIFTSSNNISLVNMGELLKENIKYINGKGGGNKILAQGAGESKDLENFLNDVYEKCSALF